MKLQVNQKGLEEYLSQVTFQSNGDRYEREFGYFLTKKFPNCERFWRVFVVPLTRRMHGHPDRIVEDIRFRQSINEFNNILFYFLKAKPVTASSPLCKM